MALGYDGKLYILAFDHRGSFQKKMFGIQGDPTAEETADDRRRQAPHLRGHGQGRGAAAPSAEAAGVLVDEQFGGGHPAEAKEQGLKLAMPVEKSGQDEFDFQYGDDFGEHIARVRPRLLQGARPLQPRRRRRDERAPARRASSSSPTGCTTTTASSSSSCSCRPSRRPARVGRRRQRPLRRRAAARADAPRDRGDPGLRHRGRHLEDRGRRRARRRARCSPSRRAPARVARASSAWCSAAARATRRSTSGCAQAAPVDGLRRLRDRALDLVGRAEGLPRRLARARGRRASRSPRTTCASSRSTRRRRAPSPRRRGAGARLRRATCDIAFFAPGGRTGRPVVYVDAMPRLPTVLLAVAALAALAPWTARGGDGTRVGGAGGRRCPRRVVRVTDGDTIRVRAGQPRRARALHRHRHARGGASRTRRCSATRGARRRQRPARRRPPGAAASLDVEARDRYGRLLAYVYRARRRPVRERRAARARRVRAAR